MDSIPTEDWDHIEKTARRFAKDYGENFEDVRSEILVDYLGHSQAKRRENAKDRDSFVRLCAHGAASKFCIREKAERDGFDYSDVFFYKPKQVLMLLPLFYAWLADGGLPMSGEVTVGGTSGIPSEGGNALATMCDISRCHDRLSHADRQILGYVDNDNLEWEAVGRLLEIDEETARKTHYRAVLRLTHRLNDLAEKEAVFRQRSAASHEGPGARPVLTNQEGQARLRQ